MPRVTKHARMSAVAKIVDFNSWCILSVVCEASSSDVTNRDLLGILEEITNLNKIGQDMTHCCTRP